VRCSVRSRGERQVLWPAYFDVRLSREEGRMVPKSTAVDDPKCEEIVSALRKLGMEGKLEEGKAFPREWHKARGRVVVGKTTAKRELLKRVATELKRARSAEQPRKS
jgi:signal recognition particle subunit SRP19